MWSIKCFRFAFGLFFLVIVDHAQAQVCGKSCTFRLCQTATGEIARVGRPILQRPPNFAPLGPTICRRGINMRLVLKSGEAVVEVGKQRNPISQFMPKCLTEKFTKGFFKVSPIGLVKKSIIAKGGSRGNQQMFLDVCIRIPILEYQTLNKAGKVNRRVITKGKSTDCVSFKARNAQLLVELSWTSSDDLELAVVQPDGQLSSRFSKKTSQGGVFVIDSNAKVKDSDVVFFKEVARHKNNSRVIAGEYLIQTRHFENCGKGPTTWNVRASVNGKQILFKKGTSNAGDHALIGTFSAESRTSVASYCGGSSSGTETLNLDLEGLQAANIQMHCRRSFGTRGFLQDENRLV